VPENVLKCAFQDAKIKKNSSEKALSLPTKSF